MNAEAIELRVELDPWTKREENRAPLPEGVCLVCVYDLHLGVDAVLELVCLNRTPTHDELWLAHPQVEIDAVPFPAILDDSDIRGRVVRAPRGGKTHDAARRLLKALIRSRRGFAWPTRWHAGGVIDEPTYARILEELEQGGDNNAEAARTGEAPIIAVARRLRLGPEPTGTSPTAWRARCPETNHGLYLDNESNTFGCGYCRRKGGPEELEAFVAERAARVARAAASRSTK